MRRGSAVVLAAAALAAAVVPAVPSPSEDGEVVIVSCVVPPGAEGCDPFATQPSADPPQEGGEQSASPPVPSLPPSDVATPAAPGPPPLPRAQRPFAWANDNNATCLTLVTGVSPHRALALLAPDPAIGPASPRRVAEWAGGGGLTDYRQAVVAGRVGDWTYVWEDNGYACSMPEAVRAFAPSRRFVSAYWNVNARTSVTVAERGRVRAAFDPGIGEQLVGRRLKSQRGLDWDHFPSAMLAFVAAETGVRVTDADWPYRLAMTAAGVRI